MTKTGEQGREGRVEGVEAEDGKVAKKRPVHGRPSDEKSRAAQPAVREESRQDVVPPLDHRPRDGGTHDRRAQRKEVHSGVHHGEHGGPQAGRVLAHTHVQGSRREGSYGEDRGRGSGAGRRSAWGGGPQACGSATIRRRHRLVALGGDKKGLGIAAPSGRHIKRGRKPALREKIRNLDLGPKRWKREPQPSSSEFRRRRRAW